MFFQYLPDVYIGEGVKDDESFKYRLVKNIFRRVKVREDLEKHIDFKMMKLQHLYHIDYMEMFNMTGLFYYVIISPISMKNGLKSIQT